MRIRDFLVVLGLRSLMAKKIEYWKAHTSFWVPRNLSNHMERQARTGESREMTEPEFVNLFEEPRNRREMTEPEFVNLFKEPRNRFLGSLKGLQIRVQCRSGWTDNRKQNTLVPLTDGNGRKGHLHKVRTYKEYHSVCPSSELGLPPTPHCAIC